MSVLMRRDLVGVGVCWDWVSLPGLLVSVLGVGWACARKALWEG